MHLPQERSREGWFRNVLAKIQLVEHSGLDRSVVSDVDNVFLAETPELFMLLNEFDFVFVGSPVYGRIIQTNLWSFRRNEGTVRFSHSWYEHALQARFAEAGGLPHALLEDRGDLDIKVLARPKPSRNERFLLAPYDVQANFGGFVLQADGLGLREPEMGRAKVLHLGGLRPRGDPSVKERMQSLVDRFPSSVAAFDLYLQFANRAAQRLGLQGEPPAYVRRWAYGARVLETRDELPAFLNHRGLVKRGAVVGGADVAFSETILRHWNGSALISIDTWPDGRSYEGAKARLDVFGSRSDTWRTTPEEAAARIEPASLDFVYIASSHDREVLAAELRRWFGKVHSAGLLAGNGYSGAAEGGVVKSAVDDFAAAKGLTVHTTYAEAPSKTWFIEVP